jgi:hypothetical protein
MGVKRHKLALEETMSSVKSRNSVIVRAYADEPVEMVVVAQGDEWVEVTKESGNESLRLPRNMVFTASRSHKLTAAFRSGDAKRLRSLWAEAEPYVSG